MVSEAVQEPSTSTTTTEIKEEPLKIPEPVSTHVAHLESPSSGGGSAVKQEVAPVLQIKDLPAVIEN